MNAGGATASTKPNLPPKYDPELVKCGILETMLIELDPQRLKVRDLALMVIADPKDTLAVETAIQAIHDLQRHGLVRYRKSNLIFWRKDNLTVDLTDAAREAYALLMG